jgi:hypothetical protein
MKGFAVAAMCGALWCTSAEAAQLQFTVSGDEDLQFTIDEGRAPDSFTSDSFTFNNVMMSNPLMGVPIGPENLTFYVASAGGGFTYGAGAQLFTGTTSAPTLSPGAFGLHDRYWVADNCATHFSGANCFTYTLSISEIPDPPPVPEPSTWAMMLLGFGAIGAAVRYSRRRHPSRLLKPSSCEP